MNRGKKTQKVKTKTQAFNPKDYIKTGLTVDEVSQIKEAFDLYDEDHSGTIDTQELKKCLQGLGIEASNQTLTNMISEIDQDNNGDIDFGEFITLMTMKVKKDKETRDHLLKIYKIFLGKDADTAKGIEVKHLQTISKRINDDSTQDELINMITKADINEDGFVDFEEFYAYMCK